MEPGKKEKPTKVDPQPMPEKISTGTVTKTETTERDEKKAGA